MRRLTRAEFLEMMALAGAGSAVLGACGGDSAGGSAPPEGAALPSRDGRASAEASAKRDRRTVVVARGPSPGNNVERAVAAVGGMKAFVRPGDVVVVKPNVIHARTPEYAVTTNPEVVGAVVRLAVQAGAAKVLMMDNPLDGSPRNNYEVAGIAPAVENAGGSVHVMGEPGYRSYRIPGHVLGTHPIYRDIVDADVLINVPVAKQHGSTGLTLAGKNMMGATSDRGRMHRLGLSQTIAELNAALLPELAVVDATRILLRNGPSGGDLADVERKDTVVVSADWVAADAWTTRLFGMSPDLVPYIAASARMGLGTDDLSGVTVAEV